MHMSPVTVQMSFAKVIWLYYTSIMVPLTKNAIIIIVDTYVSGKRFIISCFIKENNKSLLVFMIKKLLILLTMKFLIEN